MWTEIYPQDVDIAKRGGVQQQQFERGAIHVVIPCWKGDQDQAIRLLEWIAELGMVQAPFWLACSADCQVDRMLGIARRAFSIVNHIPDGERMISNWHEHGDHPKSAAGPNSLFRQVAWNFAIPQPKGPWLFLEPDAYPCRKDWYELISREYAICGKPFMGYEVNPVNHPGVPRHLSGVAVYSPNTPNIAPDAVYLAEVAFDIAGAPQILGNAHFTNLIYHRYRAAAFTSEEDFNSRVDANLALYHADKSGSIIPFLRKRLGMVTATAPIIDTSSTTEWKESMRINDIAVEKAMDRHGPIVDIFIKTCSKDAEWHEWCMKSIEKHCHGFRRVHVQGEEGDQKSFYLWQQRAKMYADQHLAMAYPDDVPPDYILFTDSDTVFTKDITPEYFLRDGKSVWRHTPFGQSREDQKIWGPVMEKFLGKTPDQEWMREHPHFLPTWALKEIRTFCEYRHGKSLSDYIMEQAPAEAITPLAFSEWNCMGFFLWTFHHDKIHWLDDSKPLACTYQGHTWSGEERKQQDLAKFKELLEPVSQQGAGDGVTRPPLTLQDALAFLASQGANEKVIEDLRRSVSPKKRGGRPKGSKNKPKAVQPKKDRWLLAIHSYPGANEAVERHWNNFLLSGADRIVGIGTTDGKCTFPCESVNIGENAYMKLKGKDDHLCRRLADTVEWCLEQPGDRFVIAEYDVLFLKKFPKFHGVAAHLTGGKVNGSITNQFFHGPWGFDRESGVRLLQALRDVLPESQEYPNNSPDLFFGLACERAQIPVTCPWKMFTRNSLDEPGSLDLAVQAALDGAHVIHGCKTPEEFHTITAALNNRHLELSHAQ